MKSDIVREEIDLIKCVSNYLRDSFMSSPNNDELELKVEEKIPSPVTRYDKEAEIQIRNGLKKIHGEKINLIGEEKGRDTNEISKLTFYIDPIDGTDSFSNRLGESAISLGVLFGGSLIRGYVCDFTRGRLFMVDEGKKILIDLLRRSETEDGIIENPSFVNKDENYKICLGGPLKTRVDLFNNISKLGLFPYVNNGSFALMLSLAGFDCYDGLIVSPNKNIGETYDIAGGVPILQSNKNGILLDFFGEKFDIHKPRNGLIYMRNKQVYDKAILPNKELIREMGKSFRGL